MVKDRVCGMRIDPKKTVYQSIYNGKQYYFCSEECKNMFDGTPELYTL